MFTYRALIKALGAHIIHINLNTIFYTYVQGMQSYQNDLHKVLYANTHTHTHTGCSRNWVLILVGAEKQFSTSNSHAVWQGL